MPLNGILTESASFLHRNKSANIAKLLSIPPGSLTCRKRGQNTYCYLRQYSSGNSRKEIYLGKFGEKRVDLFRNRTQARDETKKRLKHVKQDLKRLGENAVAVEHENFIPVLKELILKLEKQGLFDAGFSIVGSWCFHIYQAQFGVEFFPFRTLDFDLCVKLPYTGKPASIADLLRNMGFEEHFDYETQAVVYSNTDITVEILANRKGSGKGQPTVVKDLDIAPLYLPYLNLLTDHTVTVPLRGIGTVVVPSMPAFFVHKILVGGKRKDQGKMNKDFLQVYHVCRRIRSDEELTNQAANILKGLGKSWTKTFCASLEKFHALLPKEAEEVSEFLHSLQNRS